MKLKLALTAFILGLTILTTGCSPIEIQARDTAAALQGVLKVAMPQYETTCEANPNQQICNLINNGISAQNALLTAGETFCGWNPALPPPNPDTTPCVEQKGATALLKAAIGNAAAFTIEIKGAI